MRDVRFVVKSQWPQLLNYPYLNQEIESVYQYDIRKNLLKLRVTSSTEVRRIEDYQSCDTDVDNNR